MRSRARHPASFRANASVHVIANFRHSNVPETPCDSLCHRIPSNMADARSMLRAERAVRRLTHPHASYTSDGKLLCNLCETLVKNEAHWQSHLHSTQHTLRSQRLQEAKEARPSESNGGSKKRKAETLDEEAPKIVDKKRPRASSDGDEEEQIPGKRQQVEDSRNIDQSNGQEVSASEAMPPPPRPDAPPHTTADDDELAAFERDLAALEAESRGPTTSALNSTATISAAPMTAEQLAAQAREEASTQRGKRDQELEDEKEDAERALEEEFDEMEELEQRVRKLREKREALRRPSESAEGKPMVILDGGTKTTETVVGADRDEADDDDDDDDFDEEDEWRFGGD